MRTGVVGFIFGAVLGGLIVGCSEYAPRPKETIHIICQTQEPPTLDDEDLKEFERRDPILFKRVNKLIDRQVELRSEGIVARSIDKVIDEATASVEGKKTVTGIWSALGMKLFQFVRVAVRAIYIAITVDVIQAYWYIFWPLVVAVISVVFWMNGWMAKLLGKKS